MPETVNIPRETTAQRMATALETMASESLTIQQAVQQIIGVIHPIGSLYLSMDATNPHDIFGGEWLMRSDLMLIGAGNEYQAGQTYGEKEVTLTEAQLPAHRHPIYINSPGSGTEFWDTANAVQQTGTLANATGDAGGNQPHNNIPPSLGCYIWQRTE